ncbi:MAG: glycosyltransferase [Candidatus Diapherotrites archaeon]|nr:glycosyltransferase [Candidatus Diapherotrites archaeon]
MVKLSVIIVNYNVKHFLQCLISVYNATINIESEVFVVDNNSVDGSCSLVKEKFPETILIENKKNYGFSYANNQAIKQAKGQYKVKNPELAKLFQILKEKETKFKKVTYTHVPRTNEYVNIADSILNKAMDTGKGISKESI